MKPNKIKQLWAQGKPATLGWISVANSFTAEMMASQGFDAVCIDMQHGETGLSTLMGMLQAVSATDATPVVRVGWNEPAAIMKALDFGASAIIVPLINNAEEARKAVSACRYPPAGDRSSGPVRAMQIHGPDYISEANDDVILMAMIETKEGLVNLEEICATPGVDAIYIGPADLSFALGMAPRADNPDPLHMATCDRIKEAAHRHGKKVCMHCASAGFAAGAIQRGFDLVMITSDLGSMIAGVKLQINAFNEALQIKS
jgi:4-hydroxy-2-oxoheptanedioate aldolase